MFGILPVDPIMFFIEKVNLSLDFFLVQDPIQGRTFYWLSSLLPSGTDRSPSLSCVRLTFMEVQPGYFCRMSLNLGLSYASSLEAGIPWRRYCSSSVPPTRQLGRSLRPITADVPLGHLIKGVAVRFLYFYKVTDVPFFNQYVSCDQML